ncbi:MAG: cell division control protein 6, partial [Methanoregula sp.]|nr:cell division control protein 6 [Methanoregula sp.]
VLLVCFDNADALLPGYLLKNIICPLISLFKEYPKARVVFLLMMSTLNVDRSQAPDSCISSVLRTSEVYFPQYKKRQVREILHDRVQAGLNPGVISDEVFTFLIRHLVKCGDMRVGIDLVKRSVMSAERYGRSSVTEEDITTSFEASGIS